MNLNTSNIKIFNIAYNNFSKLFLFLCFALAILSSCKKKPSKGLFNDQTTGIIQLNTESEESVEFDATIISDKDAITLSAETCSIIKGYKFKLKNMVIHSSGSLEIELTDKDQIPGCNSKYILLPKDSLFFSGDNKVDIELLAQTRINLPHLYQQYDSQNHDWSPPQDKIIIASSADTPYKQALESISIDIPRSAVSHRYSTIPNLESSSESDQASYINNQNTNKHFFPLPFKPLSDFTSGTGSFGAWRYYGRKHAASDLYAYLCTPVLAVAAGKVIDKYEFYAGTDAIEIDHNDFLIRYGEIYILGSINIGDEVAAGQQIGWIAKLLINTPHNMLHYEKYAGTETGNLTIPAGFNSFNRRSDLLRSTDSLSQLLEINPVEEILPNEIPKTPENEPYCQGLPIINGY